MKDAPKGLSTRKPPLPAASHADIDAWLEGVMPKVNPLVAGIDEMICKALKQPQFAVKWSKAYYGTAKLGWVIELAAYHVSANIVFFGGADFKNPPPLGTTDRTRYVKLTTIEEAQAPEVQAWLKQAARIEGWK